MQLDRLHRQRGALYCMIHGISKNEVGGRIVLATHDLCDEAHVYPWFERVNTASNLADRPSRGESSRNWGLGLAWTFLGLHRWRFPAGEVAPSFDTHHR